MFDSILRAPGESFFFFLNVIFLITQTNMHINYS